MDLSRLVPLASLLACEDPVKSSGGIEVSEGSDTQGAGPADSGPADDTAETGGPDTGPGPGGAITGLSARQHEEIGSLVYARWTQDFAGIARVEYSFDEGAWLSSPAAERGAGAHEQLLLGIPYGEAVSWRVVVEAGGEAIASADQAAETAALPAGLPVPVLGAADPGAYDPAGRYLLASVNASDGGWTNGDFWKIILDRQGRIVWAMVTPLQRWSIWLRQSRSGRDILWDEGTYWSDFDVGEGSKVHRMKIDGEVVATYDTPGLHHPFVELDEQTLAWGASDDYFNEKLVKHDGAGGVEVIWDCAGFHAGLGEPDTYCQSNALYWHEPTDTFLFSFHSTNTVVEIDHATGELLWYSSRRFSGGLAIDPSVSSFVWQHGVHYTDAGTLLLSSKYTDPDTEEVETVAREYAVDAGAGTMSEVWSFGEGEGIYAESAGEAHRLPGGNTLHNYGSAGRLREVTPDGVVVWDLAWEGEHLLGRSTFIADLYDFAP